MTTERTQQRAAFLDALAHARALLEAGAPLEGALASVPDELRDELREALRALARVEALQETPSAAFAVVLEGRLLGALDEVRAARARRRGLFAGPLLWRLGAAAAAVVLAFGVSGFAAVQASERTIPGDALYPVKEARENLEVFFVARDDARAARAHLARLAARQRELEVALERDAPPEVVLRLERGVAGAASEIVQASLRLKAAGNAAPADLALTAITTLQARIDALAAAEDGPAIALTLRRMSNYLEDQERLLRGEAPPRDQRPQLRPTDVRPLREATAAPVRTRPAATATPRGTRR